MFLLALFYIVTDEKKILSLLLISPICTHMSDVIADVRNHFMLYMLIALCTDDVSCTHEMHVTVSEERDLMGENHFSRNKRLKLAT